VCGVPRSTLKKWRQQYLNGIHGRSGIKRLSSILVAGMQITLAFDPAVVDVGLPVLADHIENVSTDAHIVDGTLNVVVYAVNTRTGIPVAR
jgi:hypothetical protein